MEYSISGVMNSNMFGIPMAGPDTCGYYTGDKVDSELCGRWIQLATFYPFARQHSDNVETKPWNLPEPFKSQARESLYMRLSYIRLMYTCMFEASQDGGSCFDPLFFQLSLIHI